MQLIILMMKKNYMILKELLNKDKLINRIRTIKLIFKIIPNNKVK